MFGGDNGNAMFSGFQYNANTLPQLQLFESLPVGCSLGALNYVGNEHTATVDQPVEKGKKTEPIAKQQGHQMTLGYKFAPENAGQSLNPVSTGLRLSYEEDEHNSSVTSVNEGMMSGLPVISSLSNSVKAEIDRQNGELHRFIKIQEENIIKGVNELKQRHTASFLSAIEKGVNRKLCEKEVEIENLNRKNKDLMEKIKQVGMEVQSWHHKAKYNESIVNALKNNLQQLMAQGALHGKEGCGESEVDDAASYTNQDYSAMVNGTGNVTMNKQIICKACNAREVSVLLLPCRHLCLCALCEGFIDLCPVCRVMKTASVEVCMS